MSVWRLCCLPALELGACRLFRVQEAIGVWKESDMGIELGNGALMGVYIKKDGGKDRQRSFI
jgi:hypothetical protein